MAGKKEEEGDIGGGSENYSQGISLEHPPRGVEPGGRRWRRGAKKAVQPFLSLFPSYLSRQLLFLFSR